MAGGNGGHSPKVLKRKAQEQVKAQKIADAKRASRRPYYESR